MRTHLPVVLCTFHTLSATAMSPQTVELVKARLKDGAQRSWELGTRAQALLELQSPSLSVFTASFIPGSPASRSGNQTLLSTTNSAKAAWLSGELADVIGISYEILANKEEGTLPLMEDESSADPASNGVAMLIANWTEAQGAPFAAAAKDQLTWLLTRVPRASNGAISHRNNEVQLWADYLSMVPPFLAYYGATTSNRTLLAESYRQIKLYREVLLDKQTGLWQHIRQGSWEDKGHWSTGQGWALMGMMRVAATIKAGGYQTEFANEFKDLKIWSAEILDAMWPLLTKDNLFHNYADNPQTFLDCASTALMAASVYRAAVLFGLTDHIDSAETVYTTIGGADTNGTSNAGANSAAQKQHAVRGVNHRVQLSHPPHTHTHTVRASTHIDSQGWLHPVVNPNSFGRQGEKSPEGQAFVLMMYAARNDWLEFQKVKFGTSGLAANVVGMSMSMNTSGLVGVGNVAAGSGTTNSNSTSDHKSSDARPERTAQIGLGAVLGAVILTWVV